MNINEKISLQIGFHVASGMNIVQAFDAVLGAGSYAKLASDLYDTLRAK